MTMTKADWEAALVRERLPAAVVDLDAFDRNLRKLAELVLLSGKKLRLATKSIRVPALIARALKYGNPYQGMMCYSCEEAKLLADLGMDDFLIAYPTVQASDLTVLRDLHEKGKTVSLVVDSVEGLEALGAAFLGVKRPFTVIVEVDMSLRLLGGLLYLGVRRSPVRTPQDLKRVLAHAKRFTQLHVRGMMAYEAQVAGLGDRNPFKRFLNPIAQAVRAVSVRSVRKRRFALSEAFKSEGLPLDIFNGGGTGSINFAAEEKSLTELSAGSALLCPHLFDYYSNVQFEPSGFFALQVVRRSDPGFATCQGGGYIASGEPGWDRVPLPYLPKGLSLVATEGCGEVQTPVKGAVPMIGGFILFRHAKAGELAERFNEFLLVRGGQVVERAPTYRGLGRCFF